MKEILQQLQTAYASLLQKEAQASQLLADVQARELAVQKREARNSAYESAEVILNTAEKRRKEADAKLNEVQEERVKFDNWMREERQALAKERDRLLPLQDRERQLAADREALYNRERDFKVRYIEKIKQHFKNTGGAPNPDEIT